MASAFVYVTDERGFDLALHSLASLALGRHGPCDIHVFCHRFSPALPRRFSSALAARGARVAFHPISDRALEHHRTCGHVTAPSLLKISAVERLVRRYDRVAYLDNDLLVFGHLDPEGFELGEAPVAAVVDMDLSETGALRHSGWARRDGGAEEAVPAYFNVGFMIFDSANWLRGDYYGRYAEALAEHERGCPFKVDCTSIEQCALNSVLKDNCARLPVTYNLQASAKFTPAWQTALVRHYCGPRKFVPMSFFRNDGRDARLLKEVRAMIGLPAASFALPYEALFRVNRARKRRGALGMRRFLSAVDEGIPAEGAAPAGA